MSEADIMSVLGSDDNLCLWCLHCKDNMTILAQYLKVLHVDPSKSFAIVALWKADPAGAAQSEVTLRWDWKLN